MSNINLKTIGSLPLAEEVNENTSLVGWDGEKTVRVAKDMVGGTSDAVQYIPQELTESQQMQARKNLGVYYTETLEERDYIPEMKVDFELDRGVYYSAIIECEPLTEGKTYVVMWDGERYEVTANRNLGGGLVIGNRSLPSGSPYENSEEPFCFLYLDAGGVFLAKQGIQRTVRIIALSENVQRVPYKNIGVNKFDVHNSLSYGLPRPVDILSMGYDRIYFIGESTRRDVRQRDAVVDRIIVAELSPVEEFLRICWGTVYDEDDGTSIDEFIAVDPLSGICKLWFIYDGQNDDAVLTRVEIKFPEKRYMSSPSGQIVEITVDDSGNISTVIPK